MERVNNLRLGESILLGVEALDRQGIDGLQPRNGVEILGGSSDHLVITTAQCFVR